MNSTVSALCHRISRWIGCWITSVICLLGVWLLALGTIVPGAIAASIPSDTAISSQSLISHAPTEAAVYLISPTNGQTVPSEFTVKFGLSGMGIAPAGIDRAGTGHHHLLIDVDELPSFEEPLPATDQIRHFGGGQTEATIQLSPGEHTLQLLLGNYTHIPHDNPVLSDKIEITVE